MELHWLDYVGADRHMQVATGQWNKRSIRPLEHDFYRCLQCATASDAIHAALAAAQGSRDLAETCCRTAVIGIAIVRVEGKLWGVAHLEGVETGLEGGFTIETEGLEDGEVVLNVSRSAECVSPGIAHVSGASNGRASG